MSRTHVRRRRFRNRVLPTVAPEMWRFWLAMHVDVADRMVALGLRGAHDQATCQTCRHYRSRASGGPEPAWTPPHQGIRATAAHPPSTEPQGDPA